MKEIIGVLSKTLNVAETELTSALLDGEKFKDGAAKFIEDKFASKITAITEEQKQKYEESKKNIEGKVRKETAEIFEKNLRSKYGLSADKIGEELLKELEAKVETFKNASNDAEKIRASKTYLEDVNELQKQIAKAKEDGANEFKTKYDELQSSIEKEKRNSIISAKVQEQIDKLQLRDDIPAETMKILIDNAKNAVLNGAAYKVLENGDIIVVDEAGAAKKDHIGNPVKFDDIVANHIKAIPVKAAGDKGSGGGAGGSGGAGGGANAYAGPLPKDMNEMTKMLTEIGGEVRAGKKDLNYMKSAEAAFTAHLAEAK